MTDTTAGAGHGAAAGFTWKLLGLAALFLLALAPRYLSVQHLGWDWDGPGSFALVNFDEGGSCRAALDGFNYTPFIGWQTIALSEAVGVVLPDGIAGDATAALIDPAMSSKSTGISSSEKRHGLR